MAKKSAKKKAAPRKASPKKAAPKKSASKKGAAKAAVKKTAAKKPAVKKAVAKKAAAAKRVVAKKAPTRKKSVQKSTPKRTGPNLEKLQADDYAAAVAFFNKGRYANALKRLQAVEKGPDSGLRHRSRVYIQICKQRTESDAVKLTTADDHYNYAIQLINDRELESVDKHLGLALKRSAKGRAGHIYYAMGVSAAMRDDADKAVASLKSAIEADPKLRIQAKGDSDWGAIAEDDRFAELVAGEESAPLEA